VVHGQRPAYPQAHYKDDSRYQRHRSKSWLEDIFD
jgi:Zn-finger nucleic acid-binding protein